jgi:copper resistance protein C
VLDPLSRTAPVAGPLTYTRPMPAVAFRRAVVAGGLAVALLAGLPCVSLAHAELDTATPADASTVGGPPPDIVLTFTEPLDPGKSSIKLADAAGSIVADGSTVDASDATTMRLTISSDLAPGTYVVRWISASSLDGDLDHGTTTFTILVARSGSPAQLAASAPATPSSSMPGETPAPVGTAAPSASPGSTDLSAGDAAIPVVVVLVLIAAAAWFLRGRGRSAG